MRVDLFSSGRSSPASDGPPSNMRMPAKSTVERMAESRKLDAIAIPLIRAGFGIYEAYQEALRRLSTPPQPAHFDLTPDSSSAEE